MKNKIATKFIDVELKKNDNLKGKKNVKSLISALTMSVALIVTPALAEDPAALTDVELAHVAYTADNIDIAYAAIAMVKSQNPAVLKFAASMISDHTAVNAQALALLEKLGAQPKDNFLSRTLTKNSAEIMGKLASLEGAEFDKFYAENELAYHKAVNDLMVNSFIPNIENAEVKALFESGLEIFKQHEAHAEMMVKAVNGQ